MKEDNDDIDEYDILGNLGEGSFGTCYKVRNKNDDKIYVMKRISIASKKEELEEIRQEAKILSTLDSDYIVKFYDSFENENYFTIIMEYCEGLDLSHFISEHCKNQKNIEKNIIYHIISDTCLGLKEIHNKKLIHRDIKPQNLFLTKDLRVKIGDFGTSKQLSAENRYAKTQVGTMMYMAPEIIKGEMYNEKVDIWALGCIVYELCTLKCCFQEDNMQEFFNRVVKSEYEKINQDIYGEDLSTLIELMLNVDPKKRPSASNILKLIMKSGIDFSLDKINEFFEVDEAYQSYIIEKSIQYSINQVDYTVLSRTRKHSNIKYYGGMAVLGILGTFFTGGLSTFAIITNLGILGIGNFGLSKLIGQNKKEYFINDNSSIIRYIENKLEEKIKEKIDNKLLKQKIIIYNRENLQQQILKIKGKLISPKFINKLKDTLTRNFNIYVLGYKKVGKTSLINAFLNIREEEDEQLSEGEDDKKEDFVPIYGSDNKSKYTLYDSKGVDKDDEESVEKRINGIRSIVRKRKEMDEPNKLIHCIWYCLTSLQNIDKIYIEKIVNLCTEHKIPLVFVHTQTYSEDESKKCKKELEKYLNEVYNDEKEKVRNMMKNYIDVLAIGEEEEEIEEFGMDTLEKETKKQIEEIGLKSSYYELIKKEIMTILINGSFNIIFKNKIQKFAKKAQEDQEKYLEELIKAINNDNLNLSDEIKENNVQSLKNVYNSFKEIKDNMKNELKAILKFENLKTENENFVKEVYEQKTKKYKEKYSYEKFVQKVEKLIYDNISNKKKELINNTINNSFNLLVMQIVKESIKDQFQEKEEEIINEIYKELFK